MGMHFVYVRTYVLACEVRKLLESIGLACRMVLRSITMRSDRMKPVKAVAISVALRQGMNQLKIHNFMKGIITFLTFHFISPLFLLLPTVPEYFLEKC